MTKRQRVPQLMDQNRNKDNHNPDQDLERVTRRRSQKDGDQPKKWRNTNGKSQEVETEVVTRGWRRLEKHHSLSQHGFLQIDLERRIDNPILGHNARDQTIRRYVEGNIARLRFDGCNALAMEFNPKYLFRIAFLNWD